MWLLVIIILFLWRSSSILLDDNDLLVPNTLVLCVSNEKSYYSVLLKSYWHYSDTDTHLFIILLLCGRNDRTIVFIIINVLWWPVKRPFYSLMTIMALTGITTCSPLRLTRWWLFCVTLVIFLIIPWPNVSGLIVCWYCQAWRTNRPKPQVSQRMTWKWPDGELFRMNSQWLAIPSNSIPWRPVLRKDVYNAIGYLWLTILFSSIVNWND